MVTLNDLYDAVLDAKRTFAKAESYACDQVRPFIGQHVHGCLLETTGYTHPFTATLTALEFDKEDGYTRAVFTWGENDQRVPGTTRPCWSPALHRLVYIEPIAQRITL